MYIDLKHWEQIKLYPFSAKSAIAVDIALKIKFPLIGILYRYIRYDINTVWEIKVNL